MLSISANRLPPCERPPGPIANRRRAGLTPAKRKSCGKTSALAHCTAKITHAKTVNRLGDGWYGKENVSAPCDLCIRACRCQFCSPQQLPVVLLPRLLETFPLWIWVYEGKKN